MKGIAARMHSIITREWRSVNEAHCVVKMERFQAQLKSQHRFATMLGCSEAVKM